ncbi:glycosyl hydrolases family 31-domain-containing protein [Pilobolus umbonatus]|nr:glycosyl hydrolases family 31-domain-containing protein [Pilobolus umbonatus]
MKMEDFKTCSQSGFCRRNRAYADEASLASSPYILLQDSVVLAKSRLYADIKNTETDIILTLDLSILKDNTARVRVNEKAPIQPRYDDHIKHTLVGEPVLWNPDRIERLEDGHIVIDMNTETKIIISPSPFQIQFFVHDEPTITLNDRGFFNFEHLRTKESHKPQMVEKTNEEGVVETVEAESEKDLWEETFKTWTDPKPNGPESIALDITFNGFSHVYGIPEHASSLSLKETRGGEGAYDEPYRLYNTDVFEYALDSPTSLYGAVPLMIAQKKGLSAGVFWMNPSETWVDIVKTKQGLIKDSIQKVLNRPDSTSTQTHWISEAGVLDLFIFLGPTSKDVLRQYHTLTGAPIMPQMFAIAYHQCRWNYISQRDVLEVDSKFDEHDMPYDVIWLDIEYTDDKKYFTWDKSKFPEPIQMEEKLDAKGRKLVTIIDPHIKRIDSYHVSDEGKKKNMFIKKPDGADYEGWCWPGQSSWIDFASKHAYDWWKSLFSFDKFKGTRENVHIWNDMNEPSVFNGPEITIQKEMIHDGKWEHRVLHNLYATLSHAATSDGVRERTKVQKRPFVLARGFYAGAHRYGPIWTGDNIANWESLAYTNPMILANSMGGIPFSGADVPGFFENATPELLSRWYQAAIFQPFFRGHAHIDTKRREPYLSEEPYRSITRNALRERYSLLPYWYTLLYEAHKNGTPMMRPMFMEFPEDEQLYATENQFMVGDAVLSKPVTSQGASQIDIYFPSNEPWYHFKSYEMIKQNGHSTVDTPLDMIPAYYRGGHIIPRRERPRRSSSAMKLDPFVFVIALDSHGYAEGRLYMDDEESYEYQHGAYAYTKYEYKGGVFSCTELNDDPMNAKKIEFKKAHKHIRIEKIQILGVTQPVSQVEVVHEDGSRSIASYTYNESKSVISIKDPKLSVMNCGWKLIVS